MGEKILAIGNYRPKVYVSNEIWQEKFAPRVVLGEHEFSRTVTQDISERYYAAPHETAVSMASEAIKNCLQKSNINICDIDLLIHASSVSDHIAGDVYAIKKEVGAINANCYELTDVACAGAMIAFIQAQTFLKQNLYQNILVSCVGNAATRGGNMGDLMASALGDLATATLFTKCKEQCGFIVSHHKTLAEYGDAFGFIPREHGVMAWPETHVKEYWAQHFHIAYPKWLPALHKVNTQLLPELVKETLKKANLTTKDIDWLITHQAGGMLKVWRELLGFTKAQHLDTFSEIGNCATSNIPYTMMKNMDNGKFSRGDKVLLVGIGSGIHIVSAIWQW